MGSANPRHRWTFTLTLPFPAATFARHQETKAIPTASAGSSPSHEKDGPICQSSYAQVQHAATARYARAQVPGKVQPHSSGRQNQRSNRNKTEHQEVILDRHGCFIKCPPWHHQAFRRTRNETPQLMQHLHKPALHGRLCQAGLDRPHRSSFRSPSPAEILQALG